MQGSRVRGAHRVVGVHQAHAQDVYEVLHQVGGDAVVCQALAELRHCAAAVRGLEVNPNCTSLA